MLPIVAIIGRPNVGKSSLLNFLAGRLIAIVDPTAGVTRDRLATPIDPDGTGRRTFDLTDTGGYGIIDKWGGDDLTADIERQMRLAATEAQLILFVVDTQTGKTPLDQTVAEFLREKNKPVLVVANKADGAKLAQQTADFYSLGFGDPVPISCTTRQGKPDLLKAILKRLDFRKSKAPASPEMKIAVVGKRNAGKSTLVNALAGQTGASERVIVSEIPGTTRDSIDVLFQRDGHSFMIIDTAGVRKKAKITRDDLEFYAFHRAQRSIRRADVVVMLIDATLGMGDVDQKLGSYISAEFKPCIIVINKWDLVEGRGEGASADKFETYIGKILPQLDYAPIAFISAKLEHNLDELIKLAQVMFEQSATRLSTSQLNTAVEEILALRGPSSPTAQKVKVYYATQTDINPPTLILFVNNPDLITEEYRRFFIRQLRERLPFSEVPIKLHVRGHHRSFEQNKTSKKMVPVASARGSARSPRATSSSAGSHKSHPTRRKTGDSSADDTHPKSPKSPRQKLARPNRSKRP